MPRRARAGSAPHAEPTARDRALRLLGRREHSRTELATKLARYGHAEEEVAAVLDNLEASGLQSDARYATSQVRARGGREGNRSLRQRLSRQGVGEDLAREALGQLPVETERVAHILGRNREALADPVQRQRLINRCLRWGFSWDEVRSALRAVSSGDVPEVDPFRHSL